MEVSGMNNKQKEYILDNYNNYGLCNDHGKPITRADMLALLNILEVNGETLDSNALLAHHIFLTNDAFIDWILEQIQEDKENGEDYTQHIHDMTYGESDTQIYKTNDGYVIRFDY